MAWLPVKHREGIAAYTGLHHTIRMPENRSAAWWPRAAIVASRLMATPFFPRDEYFMRLALREAEAALSHDDVPIGAVVVHEGEVIAAAHNERELRQDPTAHAELLALREASRVLGSWRGVAE